MSDNDYIAEYVKENHPKILGVEFAMWKMGRMMSEALKPFFNFVNNLSLDDLQELTEKMQEEKTLDDDEK